MRRYERDVHNAYDSQYRRRPPEWQQPYVGHRGPRGFGNPPRLDRWLPWTGRGVAAEYDRSFRSGETSWDDLRDEELRSAVLRSLSVDRWLNASDIDVLVEDGVVTLEGSVPDYMQARYAWDDAWETRGVRGVINRLVPLAKAGEGR